MKGLASSSQSLPDALQRNLKAKSPDFTASPSVTAKHDIQKLSSHQKKKLKKQRKQAEKAASTASRTAAKLKLEPTSD